MKFAQFSLLLLSLTFVAVACNKEETAPAETPAETMAPPAVEETAPMETEMEAPLEGTDLPETTQEGT